MLQHPFKCPIQSHSKAKLLPSHKQTCLQPVWIPATTLNLLVHGASSKPPIEAFRSQPTQVCRSPVLLEVINLEVGSV